MSSRKAVALLLGLALCAGLGAVSAKPPLAEADHGGCWGALPATPDQPKYGGDRMWCHNYMPGYLMDFRAGKWTRVGYLRSTTSWFVCQRKSRAGNQNPPVGDARNDVWLWTQGDDAYDSARGWGWFPATHVAGGVNYGPIPGLRSCDGTDFDDGRKLPTPKLPTPKPPAPTPPPEDPPSKIRDRSRYIYKGGKCDEVTTARPAVVGFFARYGDWRASGHGGSGSWVKGRGPSPYFRIATARITPGLCEQGKRSLILPEPIDVKVRSEGLKADLGPTDDGNANGFGGGLVGYANGSLRFQAIECVRGARWHTPLVDVLGLFAGRLSGVSLYLLGKALNRINPGGKVRCAGRGLFPAFLETNGRGKFVVDVPRGPQTFHDDDQAGPHSTYRIDVKTNVTNLDDRP